MIAGLNRWANVRIYALFCGVSIVAILNGCGGGTPPRAVDQPPVISEYKGWTISVTPSRNQDLWRARVRVWPPEVRRETHPGINLRFSGVSTDRGVVEQAAIAAARQHIDASLSAH